ncbi:hypothetical protein [Aliikangiella coralliicola]|uniref:Cation/multidrug efflux pump n=1 Tax=Aliikangiella coralliicola TaxID=2592383 RepID=A0A545UBZ9_9GAMM|nr:hypothetical protein [Aliikangiella coralliicola]TQV86995.1 hypothetical protein FLL46_14395 [Aliikangiella coralliicola]
MPVVEYLNPMVVIAGITGLLSIYYLFSLCLKLKKIRLIGAVSRLLSFFFFAGLTGALSIIVLGTQGYQGLTREQSVATVKVSPAGEQSYHARMIFSDGREQVFVLKGDELLVDAYVLKWKPWTNIIGLHTAFRLDRVTGRYKSLEDEQNKPRTVFAINNKGNKGIAQWREDYSALSFLLDVEHGSASFASAEGEAEYQLMVTTDGLLLRPHVE